jgi:Uma2 family endonuclease
MTSAVKFPLTNQELAELGKGNVVRFPATWDEYWEVLGSAEYRSDFYNDEIIASMSYEGDIHSLLATRFTSLLGTIFDDLPDFRVYNSNRPVYIPACKALKTGVFNSDGMVVQLPADPYIYQPGMSAETNPILLIEVLSASTQTYDWGTKLPCYKEIPSLQQIFFIEQERAKIFAIEREAENRWTETLLTKAEEEIVIRGTQISLQRIYREVFF